VKNLCLKWLSVNVNAACNSILICTNKLEIKVRGNTCIELDGNKKIIK